MEDSKNKILEILKQRGPCLPVHIASSIGIDMLFASAFLSELASSKDVKISSLKVGGSPLYFLPGQEEQLDKFSDNLPGKEKEAFNLLKDKKVLKDEEQEPSIRVALRNLKDFANYFWENDNNERKLYWFFYNLDEDKAKQIIGKKSGTKTQSRITPKIEEEKNNKKEIKEKPLLEIKERKPEKKQEKKKEKSDFVKKIINLLEQDNIEILEEKEEKKKEYVAVIKVKSSIGSVKFLCVGKDKKRISENDIALIIQKSQAEKIPVFFITPGKMTKKTEDYIKPYSGIIKIKKI